MSVPINTSRGDLIDALMEIQATCNDVLDIYPLDDPLSAGIRFAASHILNTIHGTVTVTNVPRRGIPPT